MSGGYGEREEWERREEGGGMYADGVDVQIIPALLRGTDIVLNEKPSGEEEVGVIEFQIWMLIEQLA